MQAESRTWEEFEGRLVEKYGLDDALWLSKRDFMEWVETPDKGRNVSALLQEFEERFARFLALDRTVLDTSRVLLFVNIFIHSRISVSVSARFFCVEGPCPCVSLLIRRDSLSLSSFPSIISSSVQDPSGPASFPHASV